MVIRLIVFSLMLVSTVSASLIETFSNVPSLFGVGGWVRINRSSPAGAAGFFQGATNRFTAHEGPDNSYVAVDHSSVTGAGTISNWLITPQVTLNDGDGITFWSRSNGGYPDRLEVRLSTSGASTNVGGTATSVGDFSTVLLSINPLLAAGGYPTQWTQYAATFSGLGGPVSGRIAFRYFVTDGGTGANSDYIGIDSLSLGNLTATPEPGTLAAVVSGLAMLVLRNGRGRVHPT